MLSDPVISTRNNAGIFPKQDFRNALLSDRTDAENYWRGIILFGKNVASYKFALAHALYDIRRDGSDLIRLEELAVPFSQHLCRHLEQAPKQITSSKSQFLSACSRFNRRR